MNHADKLARARIIAAEAARLADANAAGRRALEGFTRTARVIALPHIRLRAKVTA